MMPTAFEQYGHNDSLKSFTHALKKGGPYTYKQARGGLIKWSNLDHFTICNALASSVSEPWADVKAETPKHRPLIFDLTVEPIVVRSFARGIRFPAVPSVHTAFAAPVDWEPAREAALRALHHCQNDSNLNIKSVAVVGAQRVKNQSVKRWRARCFGTTIYTCNARGKPKPPLPK